MGSEANLSKREMQDGASRVLLRALCKAILADPRIGRAIDSVPEQQTDHVLSRIRRMIKQDVYRLTRI
jgi:hypothetical protein